MKSPNNIWNSTDDYSTSQRQRPPSPKAYPSLVASRWRPKLRGTFHPGLVVPGATATTATLVLLAVFIAVLAPALKTTELIQGAKAGPIVKREDSPTTVCRRWAQQVALLNGTLYMYGGRSTTDQGQTENTWNSNFVTLDLTENWDIKSPPLKGLAVPDGPPPVALGSLWHDYNSLFLYGGQFSDTPFVAPAAESVWQYSISDSSWTELKDPKTSDGNFSEPASQPVRRAAEGAGLSVPELGLSWYFGGHLDWSTVPGWSNQIDRVYLKSLLEFTHPGYINSGVDDLRSAGAGSSGTFRNITEGGVQADDFPERADGVLVFVPGWGKQGCLIGMAGGTASDFTPDLSTLDVYDIASSTWFHQKTSGDTPGLRVDPCAVIASAADASSFQIYLFGGQNLQPYDHQIQYNDMYILTIPSFTWIKVDSTDSTPSPRAGHTCTMQDGQIIVMGGYGGADAACDSPGIYVFDASSLEWKDSFTAGKHASDSHADNSVLGGSYGYKVPSPVQSVIGGDSSGGASASTPAAGSASSGPFATGKPPVFTVTHDVATQTITSPSDSSASSSSSSSNSSSNSDHSDYSSRAKPGLISAAVIAGVAGLVALYLGFCAILYRRQIRAYKHHLAVSKHYASNNAGSIGQAGHTMGSAYAPKRTSSPHSASDSISYWGAGGAGGQWDDDRTPWLTEPKWMASDESGSRTRAATSGSGSSSSDVYEGGEPSFFSVVMGPRRALRVVNGVD